MRTKTKSSRDLLKGVRVLVGRARHQAVALSGELRKVGATVLEIPFIEIRKSRSFKALDSALQNLNSYDWLILTSVNGVEAMWDRLAKMKIELERFREGHEFTRAVGERKVKSALAAEVLKIAAIGPATKKAIEQRGLKVDVVPTKYVAESVVRSLRRRVKGKRVLLVRAKVARDVIPRGLRQAGAEVNVVEAYETVVPQASRRRLRALLENPRLRPHVITFTSSSTVRNFLASLGSCQALARNRPSRERARVERSRGVARSHMELDQIRLASIGPVTSSALREFGLSVDIEAREFTIPGLVQAIVHTQGSSHKPKTR